MSKRNKMVPINAQLKANQNKVPQSALQLKANGSTDDMTPVFSFKYTDPNKWILSEWEKSEINDLFKFFKSVESMTWDQIKSHSGIRYKALDNVPTISHLGVSEDVTICELRVCKVKRVHGFRTGNIFSIIWFDRAHEVCPEGKNRTYG